MPDNILLKIKNSIKSEYKLAFISALIIGLLTHAMKLTNNLPNHDSMGVLYHHQGMFYLGRWFLLVACGISSFFDLPWVNGLLSIIYLSFTSAVIAKLFQLRNKSSIVFNSGMVVTFPVIAATFSYMFTADGYMLAILLVSISVLIAVERKGILYICFSGILLGLAMGIYQSYIALAMVLILGWFLIQILTTAITVKEIGIWIGKFLLMGVIGAAFYGIMLKLSLLVVHTSLSSYQGMDQLGNISFSYVVQTFARIYIEFWNELQGYGLYGILNIGILLIIITYMILRICNTNTGKQRIVSVIACIIFCIALPICVYIYYFVSPAVSYHKLMLYSMIIMYIIAIVLYDRSYLSQVNTKSKIVCSWVVFSVLCITIFNFAIIDNIAYFNMNLRYERDFALMTRVTDRIEQLEGFDEIDSFVVVGNLADNKYDTEISGKVTKRIPELTGMMGSRTLYAAYQYQGYFDAYMGLNLNYDYEFMDSLSEKQKEEVTKMEVWPAQGSVKRMDHIAVIKLGELTE